MNGGATRLSAYVAAGGYLHSKDDCKTTRKQGAPKNCVIHRPSLHKLAGSEKIIRGSSLIEDQCAHGIGHPNPDSAAYLNWRLNEVTGYADGAYEIHGCDGCCGPLPKQQSKYDYMEGDFPG